MYSKGISNDLNEIGFFGAVLILFFMPAVIAPKALVYMSSIAVFMIMMLYGRVKVKYLFLLSIVVVIVLSLILSAKIVFYLPVLLLPLMWSDLKVKRVVLVYVFYASVISIVLQFYYFDIVNYNGGERVGLGTDPNFSGVWVFFISVIGFSLRSKLVIPLLTISVYYTQSRLLVVMVAIYLILRYLLTVKRVKKIITYAWSHSLFFFLIISLVFFLLNDQLLSYFYLAGFQGDIEKHRLLTVLDASNFGRLMANSYWVNHLLSNWQSYFFSLIDIENVKNIGSAVLIPHNSLLYLILGWSFWGVLILFIFLKWQNDFVYPDNNALALFVVYIIAANFLHGLYSPIFLIGYFVALKSENIINNKNNEEYSCSTGL